MEISVNGKEYFKILSYKFSVITSFALLQSSFFNFSHSIQLILFWTILTQMPSLNWYQKVTLFMEFSANGKKHLKNVSYKFFVIISFALLRSIYFNFVPSFRINLFFTNFTQMPSVNWHEKGTRFTEFSANVKKKFENLSFWFLVNVSFALQRSSYFNFLRSLPILLFLTNFIQLPSLNRYERVTFFMEISVAGKKLIENRSYKFFRHYLICNATVKLLQFLNFI